ncbi:MAG: hypothetical protein J0M25_11175 [Flavobacteriales bacterium]|nr:hypothetical protein [Flavobacteriales bacterium]
MKKLFFLIFALLISIISIGQEYKISKVFINGQNIKMKGTVEITDSKIIIVQNEIKSEMSIKIVSQLEEYKEFIVVNQGADQYEIKFKFNKNPLKSEEWTLHMETKDNSNGIIQNCTYFLK